MRTYDNHTYVAINLSCNRGICMVFLWRMHDVCVAYSKLPFLIYCISAAYVHLAYLAYQLFM